MNWKEMFKEKWKIFDEWVKRNVLVDAKEGEIKKIEKDKE